MDILSFPNKSKCVLYEETGLPFIAKDNVLLIPHLFIHSTTTKCLLGRWKIRKEQKRGCTCYLLLHNKLTPNGVPWDNKNVLITSQCQKSEGGLAGCIWLRRLQSSVTWGCGHLKSWLGWSWAGGSASKVAHRTIAHSPQLLTTGSSPKDCTQNGSWPP